MTLNSLYKKTANKPTEKQLGLDDLESATVIDGKEEHKDVTKGQTTKLPWWASAKNVKKKNQSKTQSENVSDTKSPVESSATSMSAVPTSSSVSSFPTSVSAAALSLLLESEESQEDVPDR